ncbi:MAG: sigma-54-dependent Fis family transcriptional regulator [Acidobacteria bacterium]|nr:sigma-54-dependent Fis family transcriptional regulator [Acidobacteriota bacterium]
MNKRLVLIIDDNKLFAESTKDFLVNDYLDIYTASSLANALELLSKKHFDVVLLDNSLPDGDGLNCVKDILALNDQTKIILVTGYPSFENAVQALKKGVYDYFSKPIEIDELQVAINRAIRVSELEKVEQIQNYKNRVESEDILFIGTGAKFDEIRKLVEKASMVNVPVLITGETGTGKSLLAKYIHYNKEKTRPFISVNCAALPENLIESELFGAEKGSYTGAISTRKGLFEIADGGTLFLDEIAEIPIHLQSKLLGVLDDKKVRRLGGEIYRSVNTRTIAATNVDLEDFVLQRRFRNDLFYRLNVISIHLPPLREHKQDIPTFCKYFINKLSPNKKFQIADNEYNKLILYDWPGNIRELKNIIERSIILQDSNFLQPSLLLGNVLKEKSSASVKEQKDLPSLDLINQKHIETVLNNHSGNLTRTAKVLGISLSTLKRKLKEFGIKYSGSK